jgi:hypothetical protein
MRLTLAAVVGIVLMGCSGRTSLTSEIRGNLGDSVVSELQCYVSSDIVLRRMLKTEEGGVTRGHTLRVEKGKRLEEIVIAASTPGVILKAEPNKFYVSFEPRIEGKEAVVLFQIGLDGRFYMYPTKMEGSDMVVDYAGQLYVATLESRVAHLEIEQDKVTRSSRETRQVPGRRIADAPEKQ